MKRVGRLVVTCDSIGCRVTTDGPVTSARRTAEQEGWYISDRLDLCPWHAAQRSGPGAPPSAAPDPPLAG